jgi:hypothetical protein
LPGILVAIGLSFWLYYRDNTFDETNKRLKILLGILRAVFIFSLVFLLLGPEIQTREKEIVRPKLVILQDNSSSILLNKDSTFYRDSYFSLIQRMNSELAQKYDVSILGFGDSIRTMEQADFTDRYTDFTEIKKALYIRHQVNDISAIVLATDGLFNRGINPLGKMTNLPFPVYCLALGDTLQQKDLLISNINYNQIAFLNNQFPVRIYYEAWDANQSLSNLSVETDGKMIEKESFLIEGNPGNGFIDIQLSAQETGLKRYTFKLEPLEGEILNLNNEKSIFINVIDNQQNIQIVGRGAHPDIAALNRALQQNPNFNVKVSLAQNIETDINKTDLFIFHELPSSQMPISNLLKRIQQQNTACMFIVGRNTDFAHFNQLGYPVRISQKTQEFELAQPKLNADFNAFEVPPALLKNLSQLPPLNVPFADIRFSDNHDIMFSQILSGIETDIPLIAFSLEAEQKKAFIFGSGLWRWRINDFKYNGNHQAFDELINKIAQFLVTQSSGEQFSVFANQFYSDNEPIIFKAELYNDAWELDNTPEVNMTVKDSSGNELNYTFNKGMNSYRLDIGNLKTGEYQWKAECEYQSTKMSDSGIFIVHAISAEGLKTKADHQLLSMISHQSNGLLFYPNQIDSLTNHLLSADTSKAKIYLNDSRNPLIYLHWIFFVMLAWISTEWFLRKFYGSY